MTTNEAVMASFTEEQRRTAILLQQDFERCDFNRDISVCTTILQSLMPSWSEEALLQQPVRSFRNASVLYQRLHCDSIVVTSALTLLACRDGIHLLKEERDEVAALQGEIMQLETVFNSNITNAKGAVSLETAALRGVPHHVLSKVRFRLHYSTRIIATIIRTA
jgi:Zn-dependent oligopeptidase